jgi:hypothetical protein
MAVESTISFSGAGFLDANYVPPEGVIFGVPTAGAFVVNSTEETIVGLGLGDTPGSPISSSVNIKANVDNLNANLVDGNDRLQIGGDVTNSSVEMGDGRDTFYVEGNFIESGVTAGAGRDVLRFDGTVENSYIDAGADDDLVAFFGDVNGSVVNLGTGKDQAVFYGDVTNTDLDLGSDGVVDIVRINDPLADTTGLVIEGAGVEDILFIGTSQYSYQGDYTWQNINDPLDEKIFGP